MATEVQDPLGESPAIAPAPAPKIPDYLAAQPQAPGLAPGMGVTAPGIPAAQILGGGTSADLARRAAELMPMPDPAAYQAAQNRYADTVQDYLKTGRGFQESYDAKAKEVDLAAQQYQEKAQQFLPQTAGVQPAPPRSLRGFLAPTADEDPYTTVSKFMQSVSLLATMMGGGRNGARASVSALTGAVEGWTKGDRYRADSEYQTWKDTTEALFRQFDDEMRQYNSIMIAERVPLEQKLRALETTAWSQKNQMAAKAFEVGQAREAFEHLDKMRQTAVGAQMQAASIRGMYERSEADRAVRIRALEAEIAKTNKLLDVKAAEGALKDALAARTLALKEAESGAKIAALEARAAKAELGKAPPEASQKVFRDTGLVDQKLGELMRLLDSPNVNINKIVGGIRPWVNKIIQQWGQPNSPTPPPGTSTGAIETKGLKGLTADEMRFLGLLQDYGDSVLRQRSGAAINNNEMARMLAFVADQSVTPQTVKVRLTTARDINLAARENERKLLESMKVYEVPAPYTPPPVTPQRSTPSGESLSRTSPLYEKARARGMTDEQITSKYGITITD